MMYSNKLAAAIKVAGKVLREFDKDKIYIPFGSEYSVYLKNMHTRRAVAHIVIDGKDVGDGSGFVVPAGGTIDIERFITNGNMEEGNRFKFIERTGAVEQHRGIGIEDGLIEVNFQFEREPVKINHFVDPNPYLYGSSSGGWGGQSRSLDSPLRGMTTNSVKASYSSDTQAAGHVYSSHDLGSTTDSTDYVVTNTANETGVTAPGSISDQQFHDAGYIPLEVTKHSMVFQLLGETEDNRAIREAVTVKHKPKCVSCGHINRYDAKFCSECGTSLRIV